MQTCFSSDNPDDLPIPCTIAVHEADGPIDGTIWAFYPHRCLVESHYPLTPGMPVSVTLHLSETARVRLGLGIVTWARAQECGIEFPQSSASTTFERLASASEVAAVDQPRAYSVQVSPEVPVNHS
jgi:hypothetical protein